MAGLDRCSPPLRQGDGAIKVSHGNIVTRMQRFPPSVAIRCGVTDAHAGAGQLAAVLAAVEDVHPQQIDDRNQSCRRMAVPFGDGAGRVPVCLQREHLFCRFQRADTAPFCDIALRGPFGIGPPHAQMGPFHRGNASIRLHEGAPNAVRSTRKIF